MNICRHVNWFFNSQKCGRTEVIAPLTITHVPSNTPITVTIPNYHFLYTTMSLYSQNCAGSTNLWLPPDRIWCCLSSMPQSTFYSVNELIEPCQRELHCCGCLLEITTRRRRWSTERDRKKDSSRGKTDVFLSFCVVSLTTMGFEILHVATSSSLFENCVGWFLFRWCVSDLYHWLQPWMGSDSFWIMVSEDNVNLIRGLESTTFTMSGARHFSFNFP